MDYKSYRVDQTLCHAVANDVDQWLHEHARGETTAIAGLDRWRDHFERAQRKRVREALGLRCNAVLVTWDLDQLENEDYSSRLADIERLAQIPSVHIVLHGNVWVLRSATFRRFAQRYGNRMIYAGSSRKLYEDIRLVAAADLMLVDVGGLSCNGKRESAAVATQNEDTRYLRAMALGSRFDADMERLLLDSADLLREVQDGGMKVIRDELDRLADECLHGTLVTGSKPLPGF